MGIKVVHHQSDALGLWVSQRDLFDEARPILLGLGFGHLREPPAQQWLVGHENIACATPLIFIIMPSWSARRGWDRHLHLIYQLAGRLIHAYHWKSRIVRSFVDIQHQFHLGDKIGAVGWRDYPADFPPRFDFVFFNTRRTVS